jgi:hydrogenase maturation protease
VGQVVAAALAATAGIEVVTCQQLVPELSEKLTAADVVVFVDAAVDVPAGDVRTVQIEAQKNVALGHHATPAALLALTEQIYGRTPRVFLVSVGAASLEFSEALSAPVAAAVPNAIAAVQAVLGHGPAATVSSAPNPAPRPRHRAG